MANISQEVNIEMLEKLTDGSYKKKNPSTKASQVIANDGSNLESHLADDVSQGELHGFRLTDGKLEYYNGVDWVEVKGGGYPVSIVKNIVAASKDVDSIALTWEDPSDVVIDGITVAKWKTTKVMRKIGGYSKHEEDGELVVSSGVRNQYKTTPYHDRGLIDNTDYYYSLFPITEDDIVTISETQRVVETTGGDDKTGSPGPRNLVGGDMSAGYFGEVPASELFTGTEIASVCGITQGTSQFSNEPWLKFAIGGKIIFKSKKTYRHSISYDHILSKGCVNGSKTVTKNGHTYKVQLMRGSELFIAGGTGGPSNYRSEWNRLMLPIHERAKDQSWIYKDNVDMPTEDWDVGFTDRDLHILNSYGDGTGHWCQGESIQEGRNVVRGLSGVSYSYSNASGSSGSSLGWSPVLEVVE